MVAVAVGAKLSLPPFELARQPFLLLSGAVVASAWFGGVRAGIPAMLFSGAAAAVLSGRADERGLLWALILFLGEGLFITGLCELARQARRRAQRNTERAERELVELRGTELASRQVAAALSVLHRLGTALSVELEPREVAVLAAEGAVSVTGAGWAALWFDRYAPDSDPVRASVALAELPADLQDLRAAIGSEGVLRAADARQNGALVRLSNQRQVVRSVLLARLDGRSGAGIVCLGRPEVDAFDERHERLLGVLAVQTAAALDNAHQHTDAQAALQSAQAAGRIKDEFLSTLSHELRTPLNAIMGWAHLLQGRKLGPDDTQRAIETIVRNASLQESMIGELLDMSSLLNGRLRLQVEATDLRGVVEDAVATGRAYARTKGIDLQLSSPSAPVDVLADATRLQQVIWSLLSNAVKYTPAGGRVRVQLFADEPDARIVVADTGAGMDPEFLSRLFSRFSRADASSTRPSRGLGLGLSVARGLVELHGGQLAAESPGSGQGSTFTVRIPLLRAEAQATPLARLPSEEGAMIGGGSAA